MIRLPESVSAAYNYFMAHRKVPAWQQPYFRKWLLYYVDFCHKYKHPYDVLASLDAFLVKLQEKQQSKDSRQQAHEAIALYFEMLVLRKPQDQGIPAGKQTMAPVPDLSSAAGSETPSTATSWVWVYEKLEEQIRVRHYSDKTLKSYRGGVRQLQSYTKSKNASDLSIEDIKAFLNYLAVKKKVSASSQNQAFNGLLFLFRHVLGKEFGKVDGVVRAKQRKNIPVVFDRGVEGTNRGCRSAVSTRLR